jgi:RimJ/RimL family protein N-acetyltransferase
MLRVALQRLRYAVPTAAVRAHVKTGNQASCRVFESLGFQRAELVGGAVEFKLLNVDA